MAGPGHPAGQLTVATERDYQRTILDTAKMFGWRIHHTRPAWTGKGWRTPLQGHAGFPDLVLAHEHVTGVLFVELKRSDNQLTEDQARWGTVLTAAGADWRELRLPDGLHDFCQLLADLPRQGATA
jgi:hypothetical protein